MSLLDQEKSVSRVLHAIQAMRDKGMVIMVDEEERENEGDIVFAGEHVDPEKINFMMKEARGLICLALAPNMLERLQLPMMVDSSKVRDSKGTAFTVSIEARRGVTTGISAKDRAQTIHVAVDEKYGPDDLAVPGHVFPLRAKEGGVLERAGHTEGSVDLAILAGLRGAAVICEITNDDGSMARRPDLERMAEKFRLPIVTIPDLINYRLMQESLVSIALRQTLHTEYGDFEAVLFTSKLDKSKHLALVKGGESFAEQVCDIRVHMQRPLLDVFGGGLGGNHKSRIEYGLQMLKESDYGVFVYLARNPTDAFSNLEDEFKELVAESKGDKKSSATKKPLPFSQMDQRSIGLGAQILRALGVRRMRIHASSDHTYRGLSGFGLEVVGTKKLQAP